VWGVGNSVGVFQHRPRRRRAADAPAGPPAETRKTKLGPADGFYRVRTDAAAGKETLMLKGHTLGVTSVAFSPDGKRIASGSWDNTLKVWDAASGQETLTLNGHTGAVMSVAFSPDGKRIATSGSLDLMLLTLKVWDASKGPESSR
jgi:WD40 repeat protein